MPKAKAPKKYLCQVCQHTYDRPKPMRAVFSDFTQIKYAGCPKCRSISALHAVLNPKRLTAEEVTKGECR